MCGTTELKKQIHSGTPDVVSVAFLIEELSKKSHIESKVKMYLFNEKKKSFTLSNYLVLSSLLLSNKIREDSSVREQIKKYIDDEYYLKWLKMIVDI